VVIPWTIVVSFLSGWAALFYVALLILFVIFLRVGARWAWLVAAFIVQVVDACLMAR
jgi:hypothetical protein